MIETHPTAMIQGHWRLASGKTRANLPVFAEFLLSFSPLSKHDTSDSTNNTSLNFSQPFWVVIQWLKTDNMTFFDFQNVSWNQKNLTCYLCFIHGN